LRNEEEEYGTATISKITDEAWKHYGGGSARRLSHGQNRI